MKYNILILLLLVSLSVSAQKKHAKNPLIIGEILEIQSKVLNESRKLNIYLPADYAPDSARTYPVIYLLDGSANEDFLHVAGLVQFLSMIDKMPQSIVVGIANVDRKKDFTFPTSIPKDLKDFPTTGKSDRFISFIEQELQPYIQQKYKTNFNRTIIGQSLGGLLATEILMKKPELFNRYAIISPSLWWNNESLLNDFTKISQKYPPGLKVYISVGTEGKRMEDDAKLLANILKDDKKISVSYVPMPEENHLTILHKSLYKGLQLLNAN
ncbi:alpha/beta hydrolase [Pedobacter frigidisoli]|uniref:alpha/beta hydrolase n=1 Tax=Pedobacter frigidisoli TaxID=2530455 RepID=UPI00292FA620|nr:alpha/beta hydrolase-fold protein [Pedobacter frigidisoli]